jgi:hypothetical protein
MVMALVQRRGPERRMMVVMVMVEAEQIVEGISRMTEWIVPAEEGAENLEWIHRVETEVTLERRPPPGSGAARGGRTESVLAVSVVCSALVRVTQNLVSLGNLFEAILGVVGLVLVRMIL